MDWIMFALASVSLVSLVGMMGYRQLYMAQKKILELQEKRIEKVMAANDALKEMIGVVRVTVPEDKIKGVKK